LAIGGHGLFVRKWDLFGRWRGLHALGLWPPHPLQWSARRPSKPQRSAFSLTPALQHFAPSLGKRWNANHVLGVHEKGARRRGAKRRRRVLQLLEPVVGEALLLGFFELRGDAFDAKVVGVAICLIWQGWRGKFCRINFTCCPCRDAVTAGVLICHFKVLFLILSLRSAFSGAIMVHPQPNRCDLGTID
jgi:hypothetical protein